MSTTPTTTGARGRLRRASDRLDAWLARQGAGRVFGGCLTLLAAAVLVCYVVPLTPGFVALHEVPTNSDHHAFGKEQGLVSVFWLVSTAAFVLALVAWRRGLRPGMRLLVAGAVVLNALALLVPPVGSEDVYTYSFYGVVQHTYAESPYVAIPEAHPRHPWYPFWAWRDTSAVYGPPFLLLLRGVAAVVGGSMLAWVVVMKLLLVGFLAVGVWLLVRATAKDGPRAGGWPLLLLAWNPMVLQAVAMSAHVDAIMLAGVAGAVLAHRRGRFGAAFALLTLTFLVKLYVGPLVALYGLWLAWRVPAAAAPSGRAGVTLLRRGGALCGLGLAALAGTALAYLPFTGPGVDTLFGSVLDVGQGFSSGSPPNIVRRLLAVAGPWLGLSQTAAFGVGMNLARVLSAAAVVALLGWCAWRVRPDRDPWPLLATWLTGYLLITPWVFYWHLVPLLGIVAVIPWGATALVATVMSLNLVPMAAAGRGLATGMPPPGVELGQTLAGHLSRYAATDVTLWLAWRNRRQTRRAATDAAGDPSAAGPPASGTLTSTR